MNHISLFSGIGGFDLAAEWMVWNNIAHCEMNEFCLRVLKYYWPNAKTHTDIRSTDFSIYRGQCDILTGGFPCQPYSISGKRLGKADERHLWPHMLRAIQEVSPCWVVGENVRGLTNWNGGLVFDEVQADLEAAGYEVTPFILPAASVNAPHRRDRIWFIAYDESKRRREAGASIIRPQKWAAGDGGERPASNPSSSGQRSNDKFGQIGCQAQEDEGETQWKERDELQRERVWADAGGVGAKGVITDASLQGLAIGVCPGERSISEASGAFAGSKSKRIHAKTDWSNFPTQPPICSRNDGIPAGLVPLTVSGRRGRRILTDRQAYAKIKKESLKAAGNAIVPQVAYNIFRAIEKFSLSTPD